MTSSHSLEEITKRICSLLLPYKHGVLLSALESEYRGMIGESIPFRQLGHSSLLSLLKSIPNKVAMQKLPNGGGTIVWAKTDSSTKHISDLVKAQRDNHEGYNHETNRALARNRHWINSKSQNQSPAYQRGELRNQQSNNIFASRDYEISKSSNVNCHGGLRVPPELAEKLIFIMNSHPNGILCEDLNIEFKKVWGVTLDPQFYGFGNLYEMLTKLPGQVKVGLNGCSKVVAYAIKNRPHDGKGGKSDDSLTMKVQNPNPLLNPDVSMPSAFKSLLVHENDKDYGLLNEKQSNHNGTKITQLESATSKSGTVYENGQDKLSTIGSGQQEEFPISHPHDSSPSCLALPDNSVSTFSGQEEESNIDDDNSVYVAITAMRSPSKIYIQYEKDLKKVDKIQSLMSKMIKDERNIESLRLLPEDIKTNSRYLAIIKCEWRRVKILQFKDLVMCSVLLIDYGIIQCCRTDHIYKMPEVFKGISALATHVHLSNVDVNTEWSKEVIRKTRDLVLQQGNSLWSCRFDSDGVWLENGGHCLNDMVNNLLIEEQAGGHNVLRKIIQSAEVLESQQLTDTELNQLENLGSQLADMCCERNGYRSHTDTVAQQSNMLSLTNTNKQSQMFQHQKVVDGENSEVSSSSSVHDSSHLLISGIELEEKVFRVYFDKGSRVWIVSTDLDYLLKASENINYELTSLDETCYEESDLISIWNIVDEMERRKFDQKTIQSLVTGIHNVFISLTL